MGFSRWSASVRAGIDTHRCVARASCPCCMLTVALKWPGFAGFAHSSRPPCRQPLSLSTLWLCVLVAGRVLVVHVCHGHPGRRRRSRRTVRVLMLLPTRPRPTLSRPHTHPRPRTCTPALASSHVLALALPAFVHASGCIARLWTDCCGCALLILFLPPRPPPPQLAGSAS